MHLERQHQNSKATDDTQPDQAHAAGRILTAEVRPARAMLAGLCATLVGVGLSRFAYAPLLPEMVRAGWLSAGAAGVLGAANLAGYLAGALGAGWVARRFGLRRTLRTAMLLASASFALCAWRGQLAWFLPWRVLSGLLGGLLMGLAGPAVQAAVPVRLHGLAAGLLFSGVGIGIMAGAVLVPVLLPFGLPAAWLALAGTALVLAVASWRLWPVASAPPATPQGWGGSRPGVRRLLATYALSATAATSHMVWWPDFIARGLGYGAADADGFWFLYGAAVACCPALFARLADRIGTQAALAALTAVQVAALLLPLLATATPALLASSVCGGGTAGGVSALALIRAKELAGDASSQLWRGCTAAWGAAQATTGFFLVWVFAVSGTHASIFAAGLAAAVGAAVLALWPTGRRQTGRARLDTPPRSTY